MLRNFNLRTQICEKPISFMKSRIVCLRNFFLSFQPVIFYMHSVNAKTYQFCIPVLLFAYIIISTVYSWSNCLSWFYIRNFTSVTIMSKICFWKQEWNNKFFVFRYWLLMFLQDTLLWFKLQQIRVPTWQLSTRRLVTYQVLSQVVVQS